MKTQKSKDQYYKMNKKFIQIIIIINYKTIFKIIKIQINIIKMIIIKLINLKINKNNY